RSDLGLEHAVRFKPTVLAGGSAPVRRSGRVCRRPVLIDRLVEEAADRGGRVGADEASDGVAVAEDGHGGDALDAVPGGERPFGVDVDLGELELAVALGDLGFDRRAEHAAGTAPGGPEV